MGACRLLPFDGRPYAVDMTVRDTVREVVEREASVAVAYLFGSHARGDVRHDSDVDVGVLLADESEPRLGGPRDDLARALERSLGVPVDVIDLARAPADLVHRVLRDGDLILDRDPVRRVRFEVKRRAEYLDLKPYLDAHREAVAS
jgi:hypothetical protein